MHKVPAANLIGKVQLVVIRWVELAKSVPLAAIRISRSRGVIALEKNVRRSGDLAKSLADAGIARPRDNGRCAQRSCLSVELSVVIEIAG
jgi:hypothetical protein